jgi:hypothetical protein
MTPTNTNNNNTNNTNANHTGRCVTRQVFFSEDNLFLLLNVVQDTLSDPRVFDKIKSTDRQILFATMSSTFTHHEGESLTEMNKLVLRTVYDSVHAKRAPTPLLAPAASRAAPDGQNPIRDADIHHRRSNPSDFQERPTVTTSWTSTDDDDHDHPSVDQSLKQFEETRLLDTDARPTDVQFEDEVTDTDNTDVVSRLDAIVKQRSEVVVAVAAEDAGRTHLPAKTQTHTQPALSLSSALFAFDAQSSRIDSAVDVASDARASTQQQHDQHFQQSTVFEETSVVAGRTITGPDVQGTLTRLAPMDALLETQFSQSQHILQNEPLPPRFGADISLKTTLDEQKIDAREFQTKLHLRDEEAALVEFMDRNVTGIQEELLIPSQATYVNRMHYLEVSSSDRTRTFTSTETPYSFVVYFSSNRPSFKDYPVYGEQFMEDGDEHYISEEGCEVNLNTRHVRKCLGLRGLPLAFGVHPTIDNTTVVGYETVQLNHEVAGPNVDTVFYNVVAIKTNHVQVYFPYDEAPVHPYILLEIEQFSTIYRSSNQNVRKSFCKLFYDRSSAPTTGKALYHTFVPMNNEKKLFESPLASIDRLNFNLYNSCGQPLDTVTDVHHVHKVVFDTTDDGNDNNERICIVLQTYIDRKHFTTNNVVRFDKCVEWYNTEWFNKWYATIGAGLATQQQDLQEQIGKKLATCDGSRTEEIQCIREEFKSSQVRVDFPTLGYPTGDAENDAFVKSLANLATYLTSDIGNRVIDTGSYVEGAPFEPVAAYQVSDALRGINCIRIDVERLFDTITGRQAPVAYGGLEFTTMNTFLKNHSEYPLVTGIVYNQSMSTNISLSVMTREDENVILNQNI